MVNNPKSMRLDTLISEFEIKRRSNPVAAFDELYETFLSVGENHPIQENFEGIALTQMDAIELEKLEQRGTVRFDVQVDDFPQELVPGLALMYDSALEILRTRDRPIDPKILDEQMIRTAMQSMNNFLPLIGSMSVTALKMAQDDPEYSDHLQERASEFNKYLQPLPPGFCEFCEITISNSAGNYETRCGTKEECDNLRGAMGLILLILVLWAIGDWLWDKF